MKKNFIFLSFVLIFIACNSETRPAEESTADTTAKVDEAPAAPAVTLPYTANYSSTWSDDVSDADLLTVLNSYKYWETGDMAGISSTLADSVEFYSWSGIEYNGPKSGIVQMWTKSRDSLSSVKITFNAWRKMHSVDKNEDYVSVWFKEIDTYKTGKVDSAYYQEDNRVKNGKISWYSQHKQVLKKK